MFVLSACGLKAQLLPQLGAQRAGISALTFLKIDVSPRAAAMGGAQTCVTGDGYATNWNPAAMTEIEDLNVTASNTFWVAGINHAFVSAIKPTKKYGSFGLSVVSLTTGKMERRTEFQPNGTGEYFYASNTAVGLHYGKDLTDRFAYGASIKYVNETLAEYTAHTGVLDLGFLYKTDFKDLKFAVTLENFGVNSKLKGDYKPDTSFNNNPVRLESYPAPTLFKIGVSMVPIRHEDKSLTVIAQLDHPNDNAENIRLGAEFEYKELLYLRAGYKINVKDQVLPTGGVGLRTKVGRHPLMIDYAVDPTLYLGWIHRVGVSFQLNNKDRTDNNSGGADEVSQ